jgi:hypothetical protein
MIELSNKERERKSDIMAEKKAEKKLTDLKEFIDSVNKKNKLKNGKNIQFAFVNKKRRN